MINDKPQAVQAPMSLDYLQRWLANLQQGLADAHLAVAIAKRMQAAGMEDSLARLQWASGVVQQLEADIAAVGKRIADVRAGVAPDRGLH